MPEELLQSGINRRPAKAFLSFAYIVGKFQRHERMPVEERRCGRMNKMNKKNKSKIEEAYCHIKPYLDRLECTEELRQMCKNCERYCGEKHDYTHCEDMMCFKFYLSFVFLDWRNSSDGF
jgi:hypothetical protein